MFRPVPVAWGVLFHGGVAEHGLSQSAVTIGHLFGFALGLIVFATTNASLARRLAQLNVKRRRRG